MVRSGAEVTTLSVAEAVPPGPVWLECGRNCISYDSRSLVGGKDSEAGQFYRGGMAIAVEADRAHGNPPNAVQRARVAAAMPATHVLEVARFPHQELEKLSHLRFAQHQAWYPVDA